MEHTYIFGKVDYNGTGRRANQVEVEVCLRDVTLTTKEFGDDRETVAEFTAHAEVYNAFHSDLLTGGQCLDELMKFPELANNKSFCEIYDMWNKYHLNTMHAGTPAQEEALEEAKESGKLASYGASHYEASCAYLESVGLLEDDSFMVERNGKAVPYKYGTGWITREIPPDDLAKCKAMASGEYQIEPIPKNKPKPKTVERD